MESDSGSARERCNDMAEVLANLLSSRVRYKLLALFVAGEDTPGHARQLAKDTGEHFNSIWQELKHLESLGLLASEKVGSQVRYRADPAFPLLLELRQLIRKAEGRVCEAKPPPPEADRVTSRPGPPTSRTVPRPAAWAVDSFVIGEVD
jgi:predicted transcriptional regulator